MQLDVAEGKRAQSDGAKGVVAEQEYLLPMVFLLHHRAAEERPTLCRLGWA